MWDEYYTNLLPFWVYLKWKLDPIAESLVNNHYRILEEVLFRKYLLNFYRKNSEINIKNGFLDENDFSVKTERKQFKGDDVIILTFQIYAKIL